MPHEVGIGMLERGIFPDNCYICGEYCQLDSLGSPMSQVSGHACVRCTHLKCIIRRCLCICRGVQPLLYSHSKICLSHPRTPLLLQSLRPHPQSTPDIGSHFLPLRLSGLTFMGSHERAIYRWLHSLSEVLKLTQIVTSLDSESLRM